MNYTSTALGILLILVTWWLWRLFADIKKRGDNPDPKGKV